MPSRAVLLEYSKRMAVYAVVGLVGVGRGAYFAAELCTGLRGVRQDDRL